MIDEYSLDGIGWARFSDDRTYRYRLGRQLVPGLGPYDRLIAGAEFTEDGRLVVKLKRIVFLMLNPSDADAFKPDPTVTRCAKFASRWGADLLEVVNLFAFRSPKPPELVKHLRVTPGIRDSVNDAEILAACAWPDARVIAAWGNWGSLDGRGAHVRDLMRERHIKLEVLAFTQDGIPKHPSARGKHRIPDDVVPQVWECPNPIVTEHRV